MGTHDDYTRLLGLALRGGNLVTGSDAVQGAVHAGTVRLLLLSADASARTCRDAQAWAERGNCLLIALPCDKAELGAALGRGSVAVAALTDTGLAAAVGERLALYDSERYGAIAERLRLKSKRAAERRTARARARPDAKRKRNETAPHTRKSRPDDAPPRSDAAARKREKPGPPVRGQSAEKRPRRK